MKIDDVFSMLRARVDLAPTISRTEAVGLIRRDYLAFEQELIHGENDLNILDEALQIATVAARFCVDFIPPVDEDSQS